MKLSLLISCCLLHLVVAFDQDKWNLNPEVSLEGYESFKDCLVEVLDNILSGKGDLVITDGGRKLSNRFTDIILKHGNSVLMFFSYSYVINNLSIFEKFLMRHEYSLMILSDYADSNLMDFLDTLRHKKMNIVIAFYNDVSENSLQAIMEKSLNNGLQHTVAIVNRRSAVEIVYSQFITTPSCQTKVILENSPWISGVSEKMRDTFKSNKKIDFNGCPLNISTLSVPPNVIVDAKNPKDISGFETNIILAMGKDMNFTPNIDVYPYLVWGGSYENGSTYGILGDIISGKSEIAYGVIWPSWVRKSLFDLSLEYENDCFGWAVPQGAASYSLRNSLTGFLTDGFKIESWICIFTSAVSVCLLYVIHSALLVRCNRIAIFEACVVGFLVTVSSLVQKSVHKAYVLSHFSMKIIFVFWLFYTSIIATIYNGILAGQFVFEDVKPDLNTIEELLDSELPLVTSHDVYRSIVEIDTNETNFNLVKQRIRERHHSKEAIPLLLNGERLAYCRNLETLYYYRDKILLEEGNIGKNFHIMKDCFMTYPLVIALKKGSHLTHRTNQLVSRLVESGLLNIWKKRRVDFTKLLPKFQPEKIQKLKYIFYFYTIGMSLASIVFVMELLHHRYMKMKAKPKQEFYFDFKN